MGLNILAEWSPTFLAPGTSFVEDSFSTEVGGGGADGGSDGTVSDGGRQMKLPSLTCLPLTSCCVARGGRDGVRDPCLSLCFLEK